MDSPVAWLGVASALLAIVFAVVTARVALRLWRSSGLPADIARPPQPAERREQAQAQPAPLAVTLDLDEVLRHVLRAAAGAARAESAAISLRGAGGDDLVRTHNGGEEETGRLRDHRWDDERRAVSVRYRYRGTPSKASDPIETALFVPLSTDTGDPLGTLGVFWRRPHEPSDDDLAAVEAVAAGAAQAIENALRFKEAMELAVLDSLTGLHNRRFFYDTLEREVKRAHRYDRALALLVLDLDNFKAINDQIGHLGGDAVLAEVAARLLTVLRSADIACRVGGDEFAVILPESTLHDAEQLYARLQHALERRAIGHADGIAFCAGIAELQRDDDPVALFQRADQALFRAKRGGKGQFFAFDAGGL